MKSLNFQRNKSLIRITNEKKIKKRRNWDRIVYLLLLFAFVLFMAYYFLNKLVMVHAFGHVIIESTKIRLTDDARLDKMYVHEGDSICKDDTLFSYSLDLDQDTDGSGASSLALGGVTSTGNKDYWWLKEIYNIKKNMAINNVSIVENGQLIKNYENELKRLTNEVILDVLPKQRLDYVQTEIMKLKTQNYKLRSENGELNALMKTLKPFDNTAKYEAKDIKVNAGGGSGGGLSDYMKRQEIKFSDELLSENRYFRAPMDGIITRIYVHSFETALKSEDIMTLHKDHPAYIKAFFDQEDVGHFKEGDVFKITFPDGSTSLGYLKRFYIATYTLPEEFQKKYEPTTRSIAGDIYPVNGEEMGKWRTFYKMSVDISKFKY
ncbi:MAG: hypothetical protein K0S33_2679 [Bacteroidetes bacterium]|jgi:hypothetical protein|nr:hypothetical protein [Bacteroidota bacterium]